MKFGGKVVDKATVLKVELSVRDTSGREASGSAAMPLGNAWSWPSKTLGYEQTLSGMKALAEKMRAITAAFPEDGDPFQLGWALQPAWLKACPEVQRDLGLPEAIPQLCSVVTASAFDLAIHDAFARLQGRNIYDCYGQDCLNQDLSAYLGPEYKGQYMERYTRRAPAPSVFLYHTVGALDALSKADAAKAPDDGLPGCLEEWIPRDGVHHFKIKLNGNNLDWDIKRLLDVHQIARGGTYSLDFNETCPNLDYLMGFIRHFEQKHPEILAQVQLFEQPTPRSLSAASGADYAPAAKVKPLVADEALVDMKSFEECRALGYNGIALKACKGQTLALLMGAAAQKQGLFLCVMDLTCPGQAFLESAGLAARVPGVTAIEGNARQYLPPAAHSPWSSKYPEVFEVKGGEIKTGRLTGAGLGH